MPGIKPGMTNGTVMQGKRILLIVGGGIAAYKSLDLVRRLKERGASVRAILTRGGAEFITPLSLATLTEDRCFTDLFDLKDEAEIGHIRLSREADLIVVAPTTADLIAKMAHGLASDLASTVLLATDKPVLAAPAMNVRMWEHAATQRNLATLRADGINFVGPDEGEMACGEYGLGRMAEPTAILTAIADLLGAKAATGTAKPTPRIVSSSAKPLAGKHVIVTSGPTQEPLDPVRYIANRSSGKQGHALARAAAALGAEVTLVSGPVTLPDPQGIRVVKVDTAHEMLAEVLKALPADLAICAAAVADWRASDESAQKLKKEPGSNSTTLALSLNPDILATIAKPGPQRPRLVIGFAAETENLIENAKGKRARKGADWIVANDVWPGTGAMGGDRTQVHIVTAGSVEDWPAMSKDEMAARLLARAADALAALRPAAE
jgi:phosphopantothenoylcysteine decarboxylase/phosphopantothenate--cysteine ligase